MMTNNALLSLTHEQQQQAVEKIQQLMQQDKWLLISIL